MKTIKLFVIYLLCFIPDMICFISLFPLYLLWGTKLRIENSGIWFEFKENSWPMRTWYKKWGGTTLGHCGFYRPNPVQKIKNHEAFHVLQFEAYIIKTVLQLVFLFIMLNITNFIFSFLLTFAIFSNGYLTWLGNWMHSWLRSKKVYKESIHEQAAYCIAEQNDRKNK